MQYLFMLIAISVLVISIANGFFRGFIRTALGMAAILISLVMVHFLGPYMCRGLRERTPIYAYTSEAVQELLKDSLDFPEELWALDGSAGNAELAARLRQETQQALKREGLPSALVDDMMARLDFSEGLTNVGDLLNRLGDAAADLVVTILGGVLTFVLTFLVLRIAFAVGGLLGRVPGIHIINQICGGVLGGIRGVVLLWLLCFVVTLFAPTALGQEMLRAVEANPFLRAFYNGAFSLSSVLRLGILMV